MEVCKSCAHLAACRQGGFLAHTKAAAQARVVVTTVAKLADMPESIWNACSAVICDEDVLAIRDAKHLDDLLGVAREHHELRSGEEIHRLVAAVQIEVALDDLDAKRAEVVRDPCEHARILAIPW